MELLLMLAVGLLLLVIIVFILLMVSAWVAHIVFGLDASWLDYGISEDEI